MISSSSANVLRKPHVSCGSTASSPPAIVPSPRCTTSSMKRLKNMAWRASSTCWVARKYFCSSSGAAAMNGARSSATASSPTKNIEYCHSAARRCCSVIASCHWRRSSVKSISIARQLPRSQRV